MAASAYAIPNVLQTDGNSLTTFVVSYSGIAGDGVNPPAAFNYGFTYDTTQTPAANLATFKASVAFIAANNGFTVDVSNILVFTAVN